MATKKSIMNIFSNWEIYLFILIGVLIITISPALFILPSCYSMFDYTVGKDVATTIGGIAGPFISLIGTILLFITFKEQKRANEIVRQQQMVQDILLQFKGLEELSYLGKNTFTILIEDIKNNNNEEISTRNYFQLRFIITLFNKVINSLINYQNGKSRHSEYFNDLYLNLFADDFGFIGKYLESISNYHPLKSTIISEIKGLDELTTALRLNNTTFTGIKSSEISNE
jgi:hypothetical protein